jgi:hypothetical protein
VLQLSGEESAEHDSLPLLFESMSSMEKEYFEKLLDEQQNLLRRYLT